MDSDLLKLNFEVNELKKTNEEIQKKLTFNEREVRLLTQEKADIFKEKERIETFWNKNVNPLKNQVSELTLALQIKTKELSVSRSETTDIRALKNFFQREREVLWQDLGRREVLLKNYKDAQKVYEKVNSQIGRRGIGYDDVTLDVEGKQKMPLSSLFVVGKTNKPDFPNLTSVNKRVKLSAEPHLRKQSKMINVWFENTYSLSPISVNRGVKPKKHLKTQDQIGIFKFGKPDTQTQVAFVCMINVERKLSAEAPEFKPIFSERKFTEAIEKEILGICKTNILENFCTSSVDQTLAEKILSETSAIDKSHSTEVESWYDTCSENFASIERHESTSAYEDDSSSNDSETDISSGIIHCDTEDVKFSSEVPNRTISPKEKITEIPICPDFLNMYIQTKTSAELDNLKKTSVETKSSIFSKTQRPKSNKSFSSVTVKKDVHHRRDQQKARPKQDFCKPHSSIHRSFCYRKPVTKKECNASVSQFDEFNEKFKQITSNIQYCHCFDIMFKLNNHFSNSDCLVSNLKQTPKSKPKEKQSELPKKSTMYFKNAKANLKNSNNIGPMWIWVPKSL